MPRSVVLITGMSGTGKSSALAELARRGHRTVETDQNLDWEHEVPSEDGTEWVWREERIAALLDGHRDGALFIASTVSNQPIFYPRFDAIVLLSAPLDVLLKRVTSRETNAYGKTAAQRDEIARYTETVEPLLRAGATHEIDTRKRLADVVDELEAIAASVAG